MIKFFKKLIISSLFISVIICAPHITYAQWFWDTVGVSWVGVPWANQGKKDDSLLHTVRTAINWVLWILSFIALMLCLYAWFRMMVSGWDSKKYNDAFNILKNAAIWLAIIALSWLIVSLVFRFINWSIDGSDIT